jgi:hypothetical protein
MEVCCNFDLKEHCTSCVDTHLANSRHTYLQTWVVGYKRHLTTLSTETIRHYLLMFCKTCNCLTIRRRQDCVKFFKLSPFWSYLPERDEGRDKALNPSFVWMLYSNHMKRKGLCSSRRFLIFFR